MEEFLKLMPLNEDKDFFCIGGGQVYQELLPWCDEAYVTKVYYAYEADTHFPDLDEAKEWKMVSISEEKTCFDMEYYFTKYIRECD